MELANKNFCRQGNSVSSRPLLRILKYALYLPLWIKFANYSDEKLLYIRKVTT